jgi:hypothetical protein
MMSYRVLMSYMMSYRVLMSYTPILLYLASNTHLLLRKGRKEATASTPIAR